MGYIYKVNELMVRLAKMSYEEYARFAAKAGATHMIISRDPGQGAELNGV